VADGRTIVGVIEGIGETGRPAGWCAARRLRGRPPGAPGLARAGSVWHPGSL